MIVRESGRVAAGILAGMAALALAGQFAVSSDLMAGVRPAAVVWRMLAYFTILTNLLVVAQMMAVALGAPLTSGRAGGLTVAILAVGLVYHTVLARLWATEGAAWWADQGLHTAVPASALLFWLIFAPKAGLGLAHALTWLVWPLVYGAYALIRGEMTGFYPYPFLDVPVIGMTGVVRNLAVLSSVFLALGLILMATARLLRPDPDGGRNQR